MLFKNKLRIMAVVKRHNALKRKTHFWIYVKSNELHDVDRSAVASGLVTIVVTCYEDFCVFKNLH